ncbi:MAG: hypothetical protein JSR72_11280 [Proteobacteria bacterium]|nr:hypothetical protein [Pseudomonadota bacterium]
MSPQYRNGLLPGLALTALACLATAPASAETSAAAARADGHSVCVSSSVGPRFEVKTVGIMVFGNDLKTTTVAGWNIDGLIVQRLSAGLGSHFPVRRVSLPAAATKNTSPGWFGGNEELKAAIKKVGCRFVVIGKSGRGELTGTNQVIEGLGIVKHDGILDTYNVYAVFWLQLFDGSTGELIRLPIDFGDILSEPSWMHRIDKTYWPSSPAAVAGNAKLRDAVRNVVTKSVARYSALIAKAMTEH